MKWYKNEWIEEEKDMEQEWISEEKGGTRMSENNNENWDTTQRSRDKKDNKKEKTKQIKN